MMSKYLLCLWVMISIAGGCLGQTIHNRDIAFLKVDSLILPDSTAEATIAPLRQALKGEMERVIGESDQILIAKKPDSPLSSLVADMLVSSVAQLSSHTDTIPKADFAVVNIKGLRASLPKGTICVRNIYEIMPFENELVVLGLKGSVVKQLLDFMATQDGDGLSGASFILSQGKAFDKRVNNKEIVDDEIYTAVVPDYVANGGDKYVVLSECQWRINTGLRLRDAFIEYVSGLTKQGRKVSSSTKIRITTGLDSSKNNR